MKKTLILIFALIISLTLISCGDQYGEDDGDTTIDDTVTTDNDMTTDTKNSGRDTDTSESGTTTDPDNTDDNSGTTSNNFSDNPFRASGTIDQNKTYRNEYISFPAPEGYTLAGLGGNDIIVDLETGSSINVIISEKHDNFNNITKEDAKEKFKILIGDAEIDTFEKKEIAGKNAIYMEYDMDVNDVRVSIEQYIFDLDANTVTLVMTRMDSAEKSAFENVISGINFA